MAYTKTNWVNGETPINETNLNKIENGIEALDLTKTEIIKLINVTDTAPTTCSTGDKYYNTTTSKIYTATAENTWGTTGEDPSSVYLYVDLTNGKLYYYDGTNFKSYGGGDGGTNGKLLWKNPSPNSAMTTNSNITLSSGDYDMLKIIWKRASNQNICYSTETLKECVIDLFCNSTQGDNSPWVRNRSILYVNDTTFKIEACFLQFCNSTSRSTETTGCIPLYIIGYKTGFFN